MPQQELAAPLQIGRDPGVAGFVLTGEIAVPDPRYVPRGLEGLDAEGVVAGDDLAERAHASAIGGVGLVRRGLQEDRPARLAALGQGPGRTPSAGQHHASIDAVQGLHLRRRQAFGAALARLALDRLRIPGALARIGEQAVLHAILHIAGRQHRVVDRLQLRGGEARARSGEGLVAYDGRGLDQQVVDWRADAGGVVVVWIALEFHQALAAAGRAALIVGLGLVMAVIAGGDLLAGRGHQVHRPIGEVRRRGRIGRPAGVPDIGDHVAAVGLHGGEAVAQALLRRLQAHVAGPAPAAQAQELAIPVRRQAIDHSDVRARLGRDHARHLTKGRSALGRVGRDHRGGADGGVLEQARGLQGRTGLRPSGRLGHRRSRPEAPCPKACEQRRAGGRDCE